MARLGHVAFRVKDVEASIRWYAQAFGAREVFRATRDDGGVQLVYIALAPDHLVEFFPGGKNPIETPPDPLGYAHTCLLVDDIEASLRRLAGMGVQPENPVRTGRAGQKLAFVVDPDGNRLELMEIPADSPIHGSRM